MPRELSRTAAAAALAISPESPPAHSPSRSPVPGGGRYDDSEDNDEGDDAAADLNNPPPPWVRGTNSLLPGSSRRLSSRPYTLHRGGGRSHASRRGSGSVPRQFVDAAARLARAAAGLADKGWAIFWRLTPLQRAAAVGALVALTALGIVVLVFSHRIFNALGPIAQSWRALPGGWALIFLLTCATAFPPLMGYSTACSLAGVVYGFPWGWPIVAAASTLGGTAAFMASRTVLSGYVDRLVGHDRRFVAFGQVLRRDGLGVLTAIRFCPLPFSLSNGFLATIPSIKPWAFFASTLFASPKLAVHVFIGSRLALLAEKGDEMSAGDKAINWISMLVFGSLGVGVGLFVYQRTMARVAELALEEGGAGIAGEEEEDGEDERTNLNIAAADDDEEQGVTAPLAGRTFTAGYADSEGDEPALMDPADAHAALMDDDDISLWDTDGMGGYRDAWGDEEEEEAGVEGQPSSGSGTGANGKKR